MAKPAIAPGAELDGFTIGECVHRGGMATLWSVTHRGIDVPLLMKIPRISEGEDPAAIVSFEMEQMILPRLAGPHVPGCFGTGDFARQPYVVIERIPGKTLYDRLGDLPIGYEEARVIAGKIGAALADLHRQNVIHHDIKPSSILFRPSGEAVLIDFGLSHHNQLPDLLQEEFRLPYGTAPYMAPERLLGVRDDPRSDLFSLGVLLYFFTTGVRPFGESETLRGMRRRLWRDPQPPRRLKPYYPLWLQEIVLRCLEIEPVWRYPTASQLAFELAHPEQVKLTARYVRRGGTAPRIPAHDRRTDTGDVALRQIGLPERTQTRPHQPRSDARRTGQQQAHRPAGRAAPLGVAAAARRKPADGACAGGDRSCVSHPGICRRQSRRPHRHRRAAEFACARAARQRLGESGE
jgi:serine/threonine protein kinase